MDLITGCQVYIVYHLLLEDSLHAASLTNVIRTVAVFACVAAVGAFMAFKMIEIREKVLEDIAP